MKGFEYAAEEIDEDADVTVATAVDEATAITVDSEDADCVEAHVDQLHSDSEASGVHHTVVWVH